jgi:hypothetical protein
MHVLATCRSVAPAGLIPFRCIQFASFTSAKLVINNNETKDKSRTDAAFASSPLAGVMQRTNAIELMNQAISL